MKPLLITSNDGTQSGRSGYDVLADYVKEAHILTQPRRPALLFRDRLKRKFHSLNAVSAWVQLSSRNLEEAAAQALANETFDLVHMLWADRDWGTIDRICRREKVPLVVTVHACPDELPDILVRPKRFGGVSAFFLMSSHQKLFFLNHGVADERIHVIPHGIDIEYFQPGKENTPPCRILTVGSYRRNFDLLEAVVAEMEQERDVRFDIVSGVAQRERFQSFKNVDFHSGISNASLLQIYQKATVFLMTAVEATANNAMVEALACGLPVVCEKVGGLPEYATADCAVHTTPGSVQEVTAALRGLINAPEQRQRMRAAARQRAEELSWDAIARRTEEIYRSVLG